ncbi:MAG TPA: response regulator transcription factor [Streptosporangiaceae bacterium]|nr:response regulator transcription factor [Streptosporangiaceae bacterium]
MRVLVAEDDHGLRSVLVRGLQEHDYVVDAVRNGEEALKFLRSYSYELAVLDWRMPGISGLDVVRWMRRNAQPTRILMLTARDQPADRVTGLDAGADDYLVKPFDFAELLARMRALQRRPPAVQQPEMVVGDLRFDPAARQVLVAGRQAVLTATEFGILELLVRKSPAVVPRRSIAINVWDDESDAMGSNTIDVHLARLRAKLAGGRVRIETVRGVGYRLIGQQ